MILLYVKFIPKVIIYCNNYLVDKNGLPNNYVYQMVNIMLEMSTKSGIVIYIYIYINIRKVMLL